VARQADAAVVGLLGAIALFARHEGSFRRPLSQTLRQFAAERYPISLCEWQFMSFVVNIAKPRGSSDFMTKAR
jgi:hypothetical protein